MRITCCITWKEHVRMGETPICKVHLIEMVLVLYDRPGSPPGNGWGCPRCIEIARAVSQPSEPRERLARKFHEAYERLAPSFGYATRKESAVPWEQVPEANRKLMMAVAGEVQAEISPLRELMEQIVNEELSDWGGPERKILNERRDVIITRLGAALDRIAK